MNMHSPETEYSALIKSIRKKRKIVGVLTVIAVIITAVAASPGSITVPGKTVTFQGMNPVLTVLLILLILFCALIAYAAVSLPLTNSLNTECDPQKHLALNTMLNTTKHPEQILVTDYTYLGDFETALKYADMLTKSGKPVTVLSGLFNKARCEFFLGDFEALKQTVSDYEALSVSVQKLSPKKRVMFDKIGRALRLSAAIADEDKEKISEFRGIENWSVSKATQGYINYLEGVAAYYSGDKNEAVYRLMRVKDECSKTVFASMADEYLSHIA